MLSDSRGFPWTCNLYLPLRPDSNGNRTEWGPIRSAHTSDNKIGRPGSGSPICLSRVLLQTELDDTKSYYQLIIEITISKKRKIAKL